MTTNIYDNFPIVRQKAFGTLYYYVLEATDVGSGEPIVVLMTADSNKKYFSLPKRDFRKGGFDIVGPPGLNTDILM